jgi:GNAT superfamily N-acetyltransferase
VKIEISVFDPSYAPAMARVAQRAFAEIPEQAQPSLTADFVAHILGVSNPAGSSRVALAYEEGEVLGSVAAIPTRFRRQDGRVVTGNQVGFFFVDHRAQGRGFGAALLAELTATIRDDADSFIYTFPNPRSIGLFDNYGYERVASIPTYVYPTTPRAILARMTAKKVLRERGGRVWEFESLDAGAAERSAHEFPAEPARDVGLIRDGAYFAWRYCGTDADKRYRFVLCRAEEEHEWFLLVLAHHRFSGIRFAIVADVLSADLPYAYGRAVQAARLMGDSAFVYANTNLKRIPGARASALPIGVPIPCTANPRPVELLAFGRAGALPREELAAGAVMTADWMGF